jgi:NADH-quinone oxidoreductase subunit B
MAASADPRWDGERVGVIYRSSPRQCDILLLNGPISLKLRPIVVRLYEQMPDPKWVIAMGECTICGGPYYDSYSVIKGSYTIVPTDIFIPGCPTRPEQLICGFLKLKEKIRAEKEGFVTTRTGRMVSSREGQLKKFEGGEMTYEVPQVRGR